MKTCMLFVLALAMGFPASSQAQRRDRDRDRVGRGIEQCSCRELDRRLDGIRYALNNHRSRNIRLTNYEYNQAERDWGQGNRLYSRAADTRNMGDADRYCNQGNVAVDNSWVKIQPKLAKIGRDRAPRGCF